MIHLLMRWTTGHITLEKVRLPPFVLKKGLDTPVTPNEEESPEIDGTHQRMCSYDQSRVAFCVSLGASGGPMNDRHVEKGETRTHDT